MMPETWYTHKVAYLEGKRRLGYVEALSKSDKIEDLDIRVRRLEWASSNLPSPPPMLVPTLIVPIFVEGDSYLLLVSKWESLEYRIEKLQSWSSWQISATGHSSIFLPTEPKGQYDHTLEEIKSLAKFVFVIANDMPHPRKPLDVFGHEGAQDTDELRDVSQRLCYVAGLQGKLVPDFDGDDTSQVYALAVQLATKLPNRPSPAERSGFSGPFTSRGPPPPGVGPAQPPNIIQVEPSTKKRRSPRVRYGQRRRSFVPNWVKRLWCFGLSKSRSSASSVSSSTTSSTSSTMLH